MKKCNFNVDIGVYTRYNDGVMANMPAPDKLVCSFRINRDLYQRLVRLAEKRGETVKATLLAIISEKTEEIELTDEDYEIIKRETRRAAEKRGRTVRDANS